MCGIVAAWSREGRILEFLLEGLRVLEYRGYDSVGIAAVEDGVLQVRRRAGRIQELVADLDREALENASLGIGHSRWATHGAPTDENAHPHLDASNRVALVHNGIIENYAELREELGAEGVEFRSDTDTEVLAHLIGRELDRQPSLSHAVRAALGRVRGYYAIAAVVGGDEPGLVCAREGPPLCVAHAGDTAYLASDVLAILPHTRDITFLEDGDVAELTPAGVRVVQRDGTSVERLPRRVEWDSAAAERGGFAHFMLKEIHEQPDVVARALYERADFEHADVNLDGEIFTDKALREVRRIQFLGCGTALHAAWVARYLIEGLAGVPVDVDFASEFRYRDPLIGPDTWALGISQSGETADTLAALRLATELGAQPVSICNVRGSTMVRESRGAIFLEAGPEIGVASTKAFVAMIVATFLFAVRLGRARGHLDAESARRLFDDLQKVRPGLESLLTREAVGRVQALAESHADAKGFLFLGRGINFPIALEGALKLKEISYLHAEGYPAGEMKHGPIALIEPGMTTLVVSANDALADKVRSNVEQVRARGGDVICVGSDPKGLALADEGIEVPDVGRWLSPILNVVPLQLFSYHVAALKGCDIDKPRNLAKSVTVE